MLYSDKSDCPDSFDFSEIPSHSNSNHSDKEILTLKIGARASALSQAQVKEVCGALQIQYPTLRFEVHMMKTTGDCDLVTSLRTLDKTDFFTKEIDAWVLQGKGRVGIHSAKDLPYPLREGLTIFCITHGIDSSDSLVLRSGNSIQELKPGALIATSSSRREDMVKQLRTDLTFCDLRGSIEQRLAKLDSGEVEGVVVAEAALIRLGLTHLSRIRLPGSPAEGQGKLAVVGRNGEDEIKALFQNLSI